MYTLYASTKWDMIYTTVALCVCECMHVCARACVRVCGWWWWVCEVAIAKFNMCQV